THAAVERKFADADRVRDIFRVAEIAVRTQNSESYRQVKACSFFTHIGRSKIYRRFVERKEITAVRYRGADAFARFAYGGVRQSDNNYRRGGFVLSRDGL